VVDDRAGPFGGDAQPRRPRRGPIVIVLGRRRIADRRRRTRFPHSAPHSRPYRGPRRSDQPVRLRPRRKGQALVAAPCPSGSRRGRDGKPRRELARRRLFRPERGRRASRARILPLDLVARAKRRRRGDPVRRSAAARCRSRSDSIAMAASNIDDRRGPPFFPRPDGVCRGGRIPTTDRLRPSDRSRTRRSTREASSDIPCTASASSRCMKACRSTASPARSFA
jgi:hypothetical protein